MVMMYCFKKENEVDKQKFGTQTVQIWTVDNTVLFAISDQSTCLWALLVATIMGVSKISNNTVLRKYIGLQHIQRSGS